MHFRGITTPCRRGYRMTSCFFRDIRRHKLITNRREIRQGLFWLLIFALTMITTCGCEVVEKVWVESPVHDEHGNKMGDCQVVIWKGGEYPHAECKKTEFAHGA